MQDYDIAIAPNDSRQIDAGGDWFYFYSGTAGGADSTLRVRGRSSGLSVLLQPGQAYRLAPGKVETSWIVTNKAGQGTILGTVVIGAGEITDNRITGSVEVIDGGKARTMALETFSGGTAVTAGAGVYPTVVLGNPAGSTSRAVINQITFQSGSADGLNVWNFDGPAATLVGSAPNKCRDGAAPGSVAKLYTENRGAAAVGVALLRISLAAATSFTYKLTEPVVLRPGRGLAVQGSPSNTIGASFEFYEEPDT